MNQRLHCWQRHGAGRRGVRHTLLGIMFLALLAGRGSAQAAGYERTFVESKATVERTLKELQSSIAGRLPVLDGFAVAGDRPLDRYQRGYFQSTVQVTPTASGGSVVHVSTKVTAWYSDPIPSRSGYQLLTSNGRLVGALDPSTASTMVRKMCRSKSGQAVSSVPFSRQTGLMVKTSS